MSAPTSPEQRVQDGPATGAVAGKNQAGIKLKVVAGAHRGAALLLNDSDYRIGRSPEADIILSDAGVAPVHAMLHVGRDALRAGRAMARIDATGADIVIGKEKLPLLRGCRVRLPATIAIGEARIELSDAAADGVEGTDTWKALIAVGGMVAGAVVAIAVVVLALRGGDFAPAGAPGMTSDRTAGLSSNMPAVAAGDLASGPPGRSTADVSPAFALAANEAARALNARLDAAKITTLHVAAENGRLAVTGMLAAQQAGEWATIHQWFDESYHGRFVLTTRIAPPGGPPAMPVLQLQAVWYGERPYVLAADGERYFLGGVLDNGWIIHDITEDRVLLEKSGDTVVLTYGFSSPQAPETQASATRASAP